MIILRAFVINSSHFFIEIDILLSVPRQFMREYLWWNISNTLCKIDLQILKKDGWFYQEDGLISLSTR